MLSLFEKERNGIDALTEVLVVNIIFLACTAVGLRICFILRIKCPYMVVQDILKVQEYAVRIRFGYKVNRDCL